MKKTTKSIYLIPYGIYPIDNGLKRESWKILSVLNLLGQCTIFSACNKPVGGGWTDQAKKELDRHNIHVLFREQVQKRRNLLQFAGTLYAALSKVLKLEKAFGHSNPYHRFAFPGDIWENLTKKFELAVISYSYWARFSSACPKIVVLHDLLSDYMWEGSDRETRDLKTADLVIVISKAEERTLQERGITKTHWSPPAVERINAPLNDHVGLVGSDNPFNREGLKWMMSVRSNLPVNIYGRISKQGLKKNFIPMGYYNDTGKPYFDCGVILILTVLGMGVQIKAVEALAAGRAIIARKGAMRGIPHSEEAWIEVNDPREMIEASVWLSRDKKSREKMGEAAHMYYEENLNARRISSRLFEKFNEVLNQ